MVINMKKETAEKDNFDSDKLVKNGIKLIGERFVPGASLLIDGKIVEGSIHAALGFTAKAIFGLPGALVLAANSYSKSVTGKDLLDHLSELTGDDDKQEPSSPKKLR